MPEGLTPEIVILELSEKYGKFSIEPLERGFGHTLGNAFRRVLLAHLNGVTVTDVRIEGVRHEFSTIPGVVEDSTELILNLKELTIRWLDGVAPVTEEDEEPEYVLKINVQGPGEVTAADVQCPPELEVVNPELHIATITGKSAELVVEMWVREGKGYLPVEERDRQATPIDVIPVDAVFSPVARATYYVEPTRLERRTDLDRLTLELWGDGAVMPDEALRRAAAILQDYLAVFAAVPEEAAEAKMEEAESELYDKTLSLAVEEMDLTVRSLNCLKKSNINTLGDLIKRTEEDLLAIRNFGERSLGEVIEKLAKFELTLAQVEDEEGSKEE